MTIKHRLVVVDRTGTAYFGTLAELTEAELKGATELVQNFGSLENFSMYLPDGTLMGFNPRLCIYASLEEIEEN